MKSNSKSGRPDRRKNNQLRNFIEDFDQIADKSELLKEWVDCFFNAADKINNYPRAMLVVTKNENPQYHQVIACYSGLDYETKWALPFTIASPTLNEIHRATHLKTFYRMVPKLIEEIDFSVLGWQKPRHLDVYPLRYEGHYLGLLLFEPNAGVGVGGSITRQSKIQALLRHFIKKLVCHFKPELIQQTVIPALARQDDLQIEAFINSPVPIVLTNEYFRIQAINSAAESFFDVRSADVEETPLARMIPQIHDNQHLNLLQASNEKDHQYNVLLVTRNGTKKYANISFHYIRWSNREYWWVTLIDVTQLRQFQNLHKQQSARLRTIADVMPTGLLQTNGDWEVTYANEMWCELTCTKRDLLQDLNWLHFISPDDIEPFVLELKHHVQMGIVFEIKVKSTIVRNTGHAWFNVKAKSLPNNEGLVICLEEITHHIEQADRLLAMASTDELTQLVNRTFFFDRLSHACQQASRHNRFSLLSIDLDNFKWVNDSLGHDFGDACLKIVARHLLNCVRDSDTVARIGGDEFMILLSDCSDPLQSMRIAEHIISGNPELEAFPVILSFSVGIVMIEDAQKTDMNQILKQADLALYSAKNSGKRQACFYSTELSNVFEKKMVLTQALRLAVKHSQFSVVYQLVWNNQQQRFIGAEALLRWQRNPQQMLTPDTFIELLENDGGIAEVTYFVVDQALAALKNWIHHGYLPEQSHIAVNFSPKLFRVKGLREEISKLLQKHKMDGSSLMVEITESTLFHDESSAQFMINELQKLGIKVALDDFGTGYSPLTYLTKFSIDCLKIDKSFILDIESSKSQTIIKAIALLTQELNLSLVAEGVETDKSFDYLAQLNCCNFQGFLFHVPCNADKVTTQLAYAKNAADFNPS